MLSGTSKRMANNSTERVFRVYNIDWVLYEDADRLQELPTETRARLCLSNDSSDDDIEMVLHGHLVSTFHVRPRSFTYMEVTGWNDDHASN